MNQGKCVVLSKLLGDRLHQRLWNSYIFHHLIKFFHQFIFN